MLHDENKVLFHGQHENVTYGKIVSAMKEIGADQCDVLFVHSEISFGMLEKGIRRNEIKELLLDAIKELNVYFLSHAEGFGDVDILLEIVVFLELGTVIVLFPIGFGNIAAVDEQGTD